MTDETIMTPWSQFPDAMLVPLFVQSALTGAGAHPEMSTTLHVCCGAGSWKKVMHWNPAHQITLRSCLSCFIGFYLNYLLNIKSVYTIVYHFNLNKSQRIFLWSEPWKSPCLWYLSSLLVVCTKIMAAFPSEASRCHGSLSVPQPAT